MDAGRNLNAAPARDGGRAPPGRTWLQTLGGDLSGGLTGGIASASANIPIGLVAAAPMGADLAGTGTLAIFCGAVVGGGLFVALRRTPGLQAGGTVPIALIIAGVLSSLAAQHVVTPGVDGAAVLLSVLMILTVMTGICTAVLGVTGLGRLVPLIPYPVVAGILNGGALLILLSQYRQAIGLEAFQTGFWPHPGALVVTAATFALLMIRIPLVSMIPPALLALFGGAGIHYALAAAAPPGFVGPVLGPVPAGLTHVQNAAAAWSTWIKLPLQPVLATLFPAAVSITLLSALDTLVAASAMQDLIGRHRSAQPDLLALAAANVGSGLLGSMPVTSGSNATMMVWSAGGRTRLAGFVRCLFMLLVVVALPGPMAKLPLAVIAGVVLAAAWRLVDRDSLRFTRLALRPGMRRRVEIAGNALIVLAVVAAAVLYGMAAAVLTGAVLSLLLFAAAMAQSAVRRQYAPPAGWSRTARPPRHAEILAARSGEIEVIELQGALFFGSADQIGRRIELALARGARHVILDTRRVTAIDLSGARRLLQVSERFWTAGFDLALAHLRPGSPVAAYLQDVGMLQRLRPGQLFAGLDEAVQQAEAQILAVADPEAAAALTPEAALKALGLPHSVAAELASALPQFELPAGARLIEAGTQSQEFFVLLEGTVDVSIALPNAAGQPGRTRVATLTPGLTVGEMAYLTGAQRSADVVARTRITCLRVEASLVDRLRETDPEVAYHLMAAVARQLERNLRNANSALVTLEE